MWSKHPSSPWGLDDGKHGKPPHGSEEAAFRELAQSDPQGRLAEPEEIARAVLYLASDESLYVTGTDLVIDEGYTASAGRPRYPRPSFIAVWPGLSTAPFANGRSFSWIVVTFSRSSFLLFFILASLEDGGRFYPDQSAVSAGAGGAVSLLAVSVQTSGETIWPRSAEASVIKPVQSGLP